MFKVFSLLVLLTYQVSAFADRFPRGPRIELTPGSTCSNPDSFRYPEKVPYCNRLVDRDLKSEIIRDYNKLGFLILKRGDYKIDHFIPLCMGGSNRKDNLWPQHKTIYKLTDQLEAIACLKMSLGTLNQALAIELIKKAKTDLSKASEVELELNAL